MERRTCQPLSFAGPFRPAEIPDLAARIYAAHGLEVHLRPADEPTTPIWLSSFGVFFDELDGGENFTASHSQSYKGGWKPMTAAGGQLLEMASLIADRVRVAAASGIQAVDPSQVDLKAVVAEATGGRMAEVVIEASGTRLV